MLLFVLAASGLQAQDAPPNPLSQPQPTNALQGMDSMSAMQNMAARPMPTTALLKWKNQISMELREIQRTIGRLDSTEVQLLATLKERQSEILKEMKEINTQLASQGVPLTPEGDAADMAGNVPLPVSGANPPSTTDPNLLIQRRTDPPMGMGMPPGAVPGNPMQPPQQQWNTMGGAPNTMMPGTMGMQQPGMVPNPVGMQPPGIGANPMNMQGMAVPASGPMPVAPPTEFDQDQAWAESPWNPRPSRELTELKQTVDSLRKELAEMRETVKSLETQIQLLNRNILLSQPKTQ